MESRKIIALSETDSTNRRLKALALQGAEQGTVLWAEKQTAGKGRQGRLFESPGEGIYLSILWKPRCAAEEILSLTPLAAVALRRALADFTGLQADIKWPNDLLLNGKKLCGILTELVSLQGRAPLVVLGLGLNVNTEAHAFSPALRQSAASLYTETGRRFDLEGLRGAIISSLDEYYSAWERDRGFFLEEYRAHCINPGKKVYILRDSRQLPAFALGINADFSLRVRYDDGSEEDISFGEVSLRNS